MRAARFLHVVLISIATASVAFCQAVASDAQGVNDPLEPVTGPAKVLDAPVDRTLVLGLLEQARQNSALHEAGAPPFTPKLSFTASGQSSCTGSGDMEETFVEFGKVAGPPIWVAIRSCGSSMGPVLTTNGKSPYRCG